MKQCTPPASEGNLFVDLRQQSTGLGRLRQMETKSVSVRLYTEHFISLLRFSFFPHLNTDPVSCVQTVANFPLGLGVESVKAGTRYNNN